MLTTNLSTRPFYNERAVRILLGLLLLLVLAVTAFQAVRALSLRAEEQALGARAAQALAEADRLRNEAATMVAQIDPKEQAAIAAAVVEVNGVIDQRTFSWNTLLKEVEATIPANVRVTAVEPRVEKGIITVSMSVEAMSAEELATFMNALESKGAFTAVLPNDQTTAEDDVIDAVIEGIYTLPAGARGAAPRPAAARGGGRE